MYSVLATLHVLPAVALVAACGRASPKRAIRRTPRMSGSRISAVSRLKGRGSRCRIVAVATLAAAPCGGEYPAAHSSGRRCSRHGGRGRNGTTIGAPANAADAVGVVAGSRCMGTSCRGGRAPRDCPRLAGFSRRRAARVRRHRTVRRRALRERAARDVEPLGAGSDVGIELLDCAGWSVNQWRLAVHGAARGPRGPAARASVAARGAETCCECLRTRDRVR